VRGAPIVVAFLVATAACSSGGTKAAPFAPTRPAPEIDVVYRTERVGEVAYERLAARRPFDVLHGTYTSAPGPSSVPSSGTLTTIDQLFQLRPEGLQQLSGRQPAPGTGDQYLAPMASDLTARGLAKRLRSRTVAGRRCVVFRFAEPPVGPLKRLGTRDHDDICLTPDDIVLAEDWTLNGKRVLSRVAHSVDLHPAALADRLEPRAALPAPPGAPTAAPTSEPAFLAEPPIPAGGFALARRDAFVFRQPDPATGAPVTLYQSTVWAYQREADLVTVEAGQSAEPGRMPWDAADPAQPVDLQLGSGTSVLRSDGVEIRIALDPSQWVRVRGTIPLADLIPFARELRLAPSR
jgi:hypothetical protein